MGEIYSDASSPYEPYNAVHWDGQKWELMKIKYDNVAWPIRTVCIVDNQNILFDAFVMLMNRQFYELDIPDILIGVNIKNSLSNTQLYITGDNGFIATAEQNNGKYRWNRLPVVTNTTVWDIHKDNTEILAIASDFYHRPGSKLIRIQDESADVIADTTTIQRGMAGLWFSSGEEYWLVGSGVYRSCLNTNNWKKIDNFPNYFAFSIAATDVNDIWIVGGYGLVSHFNGYTWYNYLENDLPKISGNYYSVAVTKKYVVIVGLVLTNNGYGANGIIVLGKRI